MRKLALSGRFKNGLKISAFESAFFICTWYFQAVMGRGYGHICLTFAK